MPRLSPPLAVVTACGFWALGTILSKDLLATVPPITILVLQLAPSAIVLWTLTILSRAILPQGRLLLSISLLGLLNPGWSYTLNIFGLERSTASVATLLWAGEPATILCLAWLFLGERLSRPLIVLVGFATIGVLLVSGLATEVIQGMPTRQGSLGAVLILTGVFCCAVYAIVARSQNADPLSAVAIQQTVALSWSLAIWPLEVGAKIPTVLLTISVIDLIKAVLSGLLYYAAAYWLYLYALRLMPASMVASFFSLIPLFGVVGAFVLLGERMTSIQWTGALLILAAVAILLWLLAQADQKGVATSPS